MLNYNDVVDVAVKGHSVGSWAGVPGLGSVSKCSISIAWGEDLCLARELSARTQCKHAFGLSFILALPIPISYVFVKSTFLCEAGTWLDSPNILISCTRCIWMSVHVGEYYSLL
jgi:hypothetical protein